MLLSLNNYMDLCLLFQCKMAELDFDECPGNEVMIETIDLGENLEEEPEINVDRTSNEEYVFISKTTLYNTFHTSSRKLPKENIILQLLLYGKRKTRGRNKLIKARALKYPVIGLL